jgi:patatin-like phospholipase/acyl hydrolase
MAKAKKKLTRILSIDGGGIRGIIPGQILVILEEKLNKASGNPDGRIADYFDLIAGTSTGGILTCAYLCPDLTNTDGLLRPRYSAKEVVNLYLERGDKIFDRSLHQRIRSAGGLTDEKYSAEALEKALDDYFGETKLSQLLKPCLISAYDIQRRQGHFFNQVDAIKKSGWDYFVKDIARATSAAPVYFECSNIESTTGINYPLIDGGVFVNNPALCAYAEVHHKYKVPAKEMAILSLGTGFEDQSYNYNQARNWGMAGWARPLLNIMMSGVSEVVDYQLRQIYSAVKAPGQYLRINTEFPINVNSAMDDASPENMNALSELGTETAQKFDDQLDKFVKLLVLQN